MLLFEERQMVSVPDILLKSRVPPSFIRTVSGEEHWTKVETFKSLYRPVLSCLRSGLDVWANQFGSVAGSIQSGKFRFCFLWRQVQAGRASEATSGKGCSTFLSLVCIFPLFPNTGALLTGLTPVWRVRVRAAGCRLKEHANCIRAKLL